MYLSAVSLGFALIASGSGQAGRLSDRERQIWQRLQPGVVTLLQDGRATGPAALIDARGWFVAHKNALVSSDVEGKMVDGRTVHLKVRGKDALTQLVLLEASDWPGDVRPFIAPDGSEQAGGTILAVLANGPIRAEFVAGNLTGVVNPSRRLVPLNEFRFEAPAQEVGTALVFSENGEFLGALHATLSPGESSTNPSLGSGLTDNGNGLNKLLPNVIKPRIGPSDLTVAYVAGAQVVRRVLKGFLSESHEATYPTLGVVCSDAIGGGALIQQVVAGSPAALAGIRVGDVILDIGGKLVRDQVGFAKVMLDQEVGQKVTIRIRRGQAIALADVHLAKGE